MSMLMSFGRRVFSVLLLAIALGVAAPRAALAQGTNGAVPDPITGRELEIYASRLGLSGAQRLATEGAHARYLDAFSELRNADIENFMKTSRSLLPTLMMNPNMKAARDVLADLDRIMSRIKTLDETLFAELQQIVTPEQSARLLRLQSYRERQRLRAGLGQATGFANPGARVDFMEIVDALELPVEESAAVDPVLVGYEESLTAGCRRLFDVTQKVLLEIVQALEIQMAEIQNLRDQPDPAAFRRIFQSMQDLIRKASEPALREASGVSAFNLRTWQNLSSLLSAESSDRLRSAYFERAYENIIGGERRGLERFDRAARLRSISADTAEQIAAMRAEYRARLDGFAAQLVDAAEERRKDPAALPMGGPGGGGRSRDERTSEIEARRKEVTDAAIASLEALLTPEQREQLESDEDTGEIVLLEPEQSQFAARSGAMMQSAPSERAVSNLAVQTDDEFLPGKISEAELALMSRYLALDSGREAILEAIQSEHSTAYDVLHAERIAPLIEKQKSLWGMDEETGQIRMPSESDIDQAYAERAQILEAALALDRSFFDDVRTALTDGGDSTGLRRAELLRERVVYQRGRNLDGGGGSEMARGMRMLRGMMGRETNEDLIDLSVVADRSLSVGELSAIEPVLFDYEQRMAELLRARYVAVVEFQRAAEKIGLEMARSQREGRREGGFAFSASMRDFWEKAPIAMNAARQAASEFNRSTLAALAAELPQAAASQLSFAVRRSANPDLYDDSRNTDAFLNAALALNDLAPEQRERIDEMTLEYRSRFAGLCDEMAAVRDRQDASGGPADPLGGFQERQARRNEIEKIRFTRDEFTDAILRRLRAVLSEEQAARLGLVIPG